MRYLAILALAGHLFAGGFWLQLGNPEASKEARAAYPRSNPMMRAGSSWDIAEATVYLTAPSGKFITGETLTVDGGGQLWGETWTTGKPDYFAGEKE